MSATNKSDGLLRTCHENIRLWACFRSYGPFEFRINFWSYESF